MVGGILTSDDLSYWWGRVGSSLCGAKSLSQLFIYTHLHHKVQVAHNTLHQAAHFQVFFSFTM